ncbi:MAG: hypothetical protein ACE3JP_01520 [Ectobacillus sp.]
MRIQGSNSNAKLAWQRQQLQNIAGDRQLQLLSGSRAVAFSLHKEADAAGIPLLSVHDGLTAVQAARLGLSAILQLLMQTREQAARHGNFVSATTWKELVQQLNRIAAETNVNGLFLLDEEAHSLIVRVQSEGKEQAAMQISFVSATAAALSLSDMDGTAAKLEGAIQTVNAYLENFNQTLRQLHVLLEEAKQKSELVSGEHDLGKLGVIAEMSMSMLTCSVLKPLKDKKVSLFVCVGILFFIFAAVYIVGD